MPNESQQSISDIISDFASTFEKYSDKIFRHLYFRMRDREKALDLMQETFTKTFLYVKDGVKVENIQAFLYRVAHNLMIDEFKKSNKQKTVSLEAMAEEGITPGEDKSHEMKQKIDVEAMLSQLDKIPAQYRTVIVMRYIDDLSLPEIAEALQESENSIRVKLHRSLKKLRKVLKNFE